MKNRDLVAIRLDIFSQCSDSDLLDAFEEGIRAEAKAEAESELAYLRKGIIKLRIALSDCKILAENNMSAKGCEKIIARIRKDLK